MAEKYKLKFVKNSGYPLLQNYKHNDEKPQSHYPSQPVSLETPEEKNLVKGLESIMKKLGVDEFNVTIETKKMKTRVTNYLE